MTFLELFHMLNRGVEKRTIVLDDSDRLRFVHSLFIFNDRNDVDENHRHPGWREKRSEREQLVHIHAWCLMPNHYHLLVSPIEDDMTNLSLFAKKLNMGYAKYFNERYTRSGALWQGKYKKISIARDAHFLYLPYYIHLNPLDMSMPEWREGNVRNVRKACTHLRDYRWSSFLDYRGITNFPSLIDMNLLSDVLGSARAQEKTIAGIITNERLAIQSTLMEE